MDYEFDSNLGKTHRRRLVVVCGSYSFGDSGFSDGPDACDLHVGETIVPSLEDGAAHTYVDETNDHQLYIAQGDGDKKSVQFLTIVRDDLLPDEN